MSLALSLRKKAVSAPLPSQGCGTYTDEKGLGFQEEQGGGHLGSIRVKVVRKGWENCPERPLGATRE